MFDYIVPQKGQKNIIVKEFEKYLENRGCSKYYYTYKIAIGFVINGEKKIQKAEVVRNDMMTKLQKMAILFSEYKNKEQKEKEFSCQLNDPDYRHYVPIDDGEVKFSKLFKIFEEDGILPKDYSYDHVRSYLADLGIIKVIELEIKGVLKRVTFVTDEALSNRIIRIVGCKKYGDNYIYSYVFTPKGITEMRKIFSEIEDREKIALFT